MHVIYGHNIKSVVCCKQKKQVLLVIFMFCSADVIASKFVYSNNISCLLYKCRFNWKCLELNFVKGLPCAFKVTYILFYLLLDKIWLLNQSFLPTFPFYVRNFWNFGTMWPWWLNRRPLNQRVCVLLVSMLRFCRSKQSTRPACQC